MTSRRLLFALWVPLASLVLLELVLQAGALLVDPEASSAPVTDAETRILAVGDSWVAGAEAPPGQGFTDGLAAKLPDQLGRPVNVINKGRSGANSAHVALTVLDTIEVLQPDLLVVLVGQNNATNQYRVAEVEQRIAARQGREAAAPPSTSRLRTVKLAKILWANLKGSEGYGEAVVTPPPPLPTIPPPQVDNEGRPVLQEPLLEDGPGRAYLQRAVFEPPAPSGDPVLDAAWSTLFAAARRQQGPEEAVRTLSAALDGPHAVLARYALLRRAREAGHWSQVREHGLALRAHPRGALRDLGAAEGTLLVGDWRVARALLTAAASRAPGFADAQDMACRFPAAAADRAIQEACEAAPWGEPTELDRARVLEATLDPRGAAQQREAWIERAPWDLETRVDAASWLAQSGDLASGDALMGLKPGGALTEPVRPQAAHWRYYVVRAAESGDREVSRDAVERALADQAERPDAALLGAAAAILSEYEHCDSLPDVAGAWYAARGDAAGYGRLMQPCMAAGDVAARLEALRPKVAEPVAPQLLEALTSSAREPFDLLVRDLDLVLDAAAAVDASVLLLDYPNPSTDHAFLARIIGEYAGSRPVDYLPLRAAFADRLRPESWEQHLGPNGHCNARGYALMSELIVEHLTRRGTLD